MSEEENRAMTALENTSKKYQEFSLFDPFSRSAAILVTESLDILKRYYRIRSISRGEMLKLLLQAKSYARLALEDPILKIQDPEHYHNCFVYISEVRAIMRRHKF